MKYISILALVAALSGLPATGATDSSLRDICNIRAEKGSGYSGARPGLSWQTGRVRFRLSGSANFGISYSSDAGTSIASGSPRRDADERREDRAMQKYYQIFDACISAG